MIVYSMVFPGWQVAVGFVLLILVHEMGHVVANLHYGLAASPPIFVPFLGAVILLRERPANAKVEAVSAIAGPVAGTFGALACFAWYVQTRSELALLLSWFGFTINLFNLLPVPPLDGGRVAAAISPWVWILGLAGLGAMVVDDFRHGRDFSLLMVLLLVALPRVLAVLRGGARKGEYYNVGRAANLTIGAAYLVLLGLLAWLRWYTQGKLELGRML
ncbi:MAG: site-2 protease family protein [Tepidisphaeraceae bacterium]